MRTRSVRIYITHYYYKVIGEQISQAEKRGAAITFKMLVYFDY